MEADKAASSSAPPKPQPQRPPQQRPGSAIRPLTQEEKDRLNAKYGQIKSPTASEVAQVAQSGCKMQ